MNRIFGHGNRKSNEQMMAESSKAINQAQHGLSGRMSQIETQILEVNAQLQTLQKKINNSKSQVAQNPLRKRALKLLNKRKQLEAMQDQLDSQFWSMSQVQMTTENLKNTVVTVNALKQTNKALKQQYDKINIDKLQNMQDEMSELIEQGEELQKILAINVDGIDDVSESELDAELEALGERGLDFSADITNDVELPSYLSNMTPNFVDEEPTETEAPVRLETVN